MARPLQEKSVDAQSSTSKGSALEMGGRISVMMFVVAKNADTANDTLTVDLEVQQDGTNWAKMRDESGTQIMQITESELDDPDGNGDFAGYVEAHGVAADKIRANVSSFSDDANGDLEVDVYVGGFGRSPAQNFRTV